MSLKKPTTLRGPVDRTYSNADVTRQPSYVNGSHRLPRSVVVVVIAVAAAANLFSLAASQLWVYPDSIDYIRLAGGLADRGDLHDELFLIRPPGYSQLLAACPTRCRE